MRLTSVLILAFGLVVCGPASADIIYSNGPINGTITAYTISNGLKVANSFVVDEPTTITAFDAGIWAWQNETPSKITWAILTGGPSWSGGHSVASEATSWSSNVYQKTTGGDYPCDIYTSTVDGMNVPVVAGTYYLELSGGLSNIADTIFWDVNNGGSLAYNTWLGKVNSEAFTIYGPSGSNVPIPPSALLLGSGVLGLAGWRRLRKG